MGKDLREFISRLEAEAPEEIVRVDAPVDTEFEIAAIVRRLQADNEYPAVFCETIEGYPDFQAITNVAASREKLALIVDSDLDGYIDEFIRRADRPRPLEVVDASAAPVKEVVAAGDEVDLGALPLYKKTPAEPAPFIDAGVLVTRDEENDRFNTGIFRMQKHGPRRTGLFMAEGTHTHSIYRYHEERGEPMEFAAYIGMHPAAVVGSQIHTQGDELEAIAGLLDEPLEVVDCETVDLQVPARAEIVIEGQVLPDERQAEGPFCEFTYLLGLERESPVAEVTAITRRERPIFYDVYNPYVDHVNHGALTLESDVYRRAKETITQTLDAYVPAFASKFLVILQVRKEYEGVGKQAAMAALSAKSTHLKTCIVVDEDTDPYDLEQVLWALVMKVRPQADIDVVKNAYIEDLDPVSTTAAGWPDAGGGVDDKVIIDATRPLGIDYPPHCEPPEERWRDLDLSAYLRDES